MKAWLSVCPIILFIHLASNIFLHDAMCTKLGLPHMLTFGLSHYIYGQPLDLMGIHLFCCAHGGEKTTSHNVIWDAFVSITKYVGFHGVREQTHILLLLTIQSSRQRVDIVLSVDGIRMLANVIIDNLTQVNLVSCATLCQGGYDSGGLSKGRILLRLICCRFVYSSHH
jgi:hypothetical protein